MISALLQSVFVIVITVISLYKWIIIISSLLSWVKPDPYNPIVQMLDRLTQPAYNLVRKYVPTVFGGMDLAPIIIILALIFLETFLSKLFVGM
ncbi:MAG: YggT family protein [Campylobacteraceae bacterium]|nr:YggT family protein [Campylobacteraceae bacterium]